MTEECVSRRNLEFLLYELLDAEALTRHDYYADHGRDGFDLMIDTALRIGNTILRPALSEMDKNQPELHDGEVSVHPVVKTFLKTCGEGGWIAADAPYALGGQQMPMAILSACHFILAASNYSASVYPALSTGAAHLIRTFGTKDVIDMFVPKLYAGEWQGTMALTEPEAGSSLMDIVTAAEPTEEGYYRLRGQKVFISAGDHNAVDNVVHLMLARIKGAPPGIKGISLFAVPKMRIGPDGALEPNDVVCSGVYHKLGYRGCPITQLSIGDDDDCRGYLLGEAHRGLSYMFQMMNEARIEVGIGAAAIASAAYHASLDYANERPQGRRVTEKDPTKSPLPIIEHADVKRMLLFQRAIVEGSLALILRCSMYTDLVKVSQGDEKEEYELLLDLLTPVAKSYPSEMGIHSVSQGLQCLGGYGYCDEFPLEQYYRDVRIHPIHEGTTGIQGMDLLGRKVIMKNGKAVSLFKREVMKVIGEAEGIADLGDPARDLSASLTMLDEVIAYLVALALKGEIETFLADATLFLEFFGIICVAWQWLAQALAARRALDGGASGRDELFYRGKLVTFRYFYKYELPKTKWLSAVLTGSDGLTAKMSPDEFTN